MRRDSANFGGHFDQYVLRFPSRIFLRLAVTPVRPLLSLHTVARWMGKMTLSLKCANLAQAMSKEIIGEQMGLLMAFPIC